MNKTSIYSIIVSQVIILLPIAGQGASFCDSVKSVSHKYASKVIYANPNSPNLYRAQSLNNFRMADDIVAKRDDLGHFRGEVYEDCPAVQLEHRMPVIAKLITNAPPNTDLTKPENKLLFKNRVSSNLHRTGLINDFNQSLLHFSKQGNMDQSKVDAIAEKLVPVVLYDSSLANRDKALMTLMSVHSNGDFLKNLILRIKSGEASSNVMSEHKDDDVIVTSSAVRMSDVMKKNDHRVYDYLLSLLERGESISLKYSNIEHVMAWGPSEMDRIGTKRRVNMTPTKTAVSPRYETYKPKQSKARAGMI